jgi:hypothetical protein
MRLSFVPPIISLIMTTSALQAPLASPQIVFQFPNSTWVENIFATSNGSLLASTTLNGGLYLIDPIAKSATHISNFKYINSVFGITELTPDTFAVVVGNTTPPLFKDEGSFSVWHVDLSCEDEPADVTKIIGIPEGQLLNGATAINTDVVLIADSKAGNVIRLDRRTREHGVVMEDASMKGNATAPTGINGIKYKDGYVYYTNTRLASLHRVKIDGHGNAIGPFETIASNLTYVDDFSVDEHGTVFVATGRKGVIDKISLDGTVQAIVQDVYATSVTFGRGKHDKDIAYASNADGRIVSFKYR